ncbi:MAG TPA: DinB family protein [Gemmatimonadales bacterium]|nr:DinB family protein [Gemmatimonadales bacterium]
MKQRILPAVMLSLAATGLQAQTAAPTSSAVGTVEGIWGQLTTWITMAAEEAPDSVYAFRPTPEVRTFGQLVAHVAGAQHLICGAAMNEDGGAENQIEEKNLSKAEIVAALKKSTEYCRKAYAQTDAAAQGATRLFGQEQTRLHALTLNATHNGEHYGNMVTYLRINGIVPPSSRRQ